jgi:hypothetical protein
MPVVETLELGRKLEDAVGLGLEAIIVNGVWPSRFSDADVRKLRAASRNGHEPAATGALKAALAEHERATTQRGHLSRLESESGTKVVTLPYLFASELGLPEYQLLADSLAESL